MLALVALSVAAVAAVPSFAGSPAKKVNGDIWFVNDSYENYGIPNPEGLGHWVFNGIEATATSPAKGSMTYTDGYGTYAAKVLGLEVLSSTEATITAEVTFSTHQYAPVGAVATYTLHDEGEQGVGSDYFTSDGINLPAITAGNIQIHA